MDGAKAQQAPHNVAVLVLPEWEAERRDLKMYYKGHRLVESYRVLACPEFQEG